jgi:putative membrane protein
MARRLWNIITVPAFVLMAIFGIWMLILNPSLLQMSWFHVKILFLIGLGIYHFWCWKKVLETKSLNNKELETANHKTKTSQRNCNFHFVFSSFHGNYKTLEYWWQLIVGFFVIVF